MTRKLTTDLWDRAAWLNDVPNSCNDSTGQKTRCRRIG
jgi:hypothetical protein